MIPSKLSDGDQERSDIMNNDRFTTQNTRLGFIGLGLMGSRLLRRLHTQGWKIRGWNRTKRATVSLIRYGFDIEERLSTLVQESDVLLSSLANDDAVRTVYLEKDGVLDAIRPGTVVLEMSTISPDLSAVLHQEAAKRGALLIDLPVSGSTPAIEAGTVTLFAGGAPETFNRCIPIFQSIARQWYLMGPATAGVRTKIVVNLLLGVNMEAIAEALALGANLGLDRELLLDTLPKTAVVAPAFLGKFSKIKLGDYSPQFPLHLMSKDLNLVHQTAQESGAEFPAAEAARSIFEDALADRGDLDFSAITDHVQTFWFGGGR
jgi:3-hydroxyisobutyrate dehydrogenase-like beta-hydroxyacid dehydrogenase